ncbi:hypothetical protein ACIA8C_00315 [Nocardia sp. NPDC051321]|uniref:hypothetical protein n=1 Tax=Nocardia sp. NPDC051321 TaxID=3364323 RepID=UPI0037BDB4D9
MTNQRFTPTLPETLIEAARRWAAGRPTHAQTQQISGWLDAIMHRGHPQDTAKS